MITLKEIAYSAGVDNSVVSRVLNGKADKYRISKKCQKKVKKVAYELGYIPNAYAVGVKKGKFHCIALLQSSLRGKSYLPEKLITEISRNLEEDDNHLLLANIPEQKLNQKILPKIFRSLMADGLIINHHHELPDRIKQMISRTSMSTVWMNYKADFDAVYPDSFSAAAKATEHLIKLGHKRISYCNVYLDDRNPNAHYSAKDRVNGYIKAMNDFGLEIMNITPDYRIEDDMKKRIDYFHSILKDKKRRPTAMVFYWSYSAPAVFQAASRLNLQIPRDLSIITFAGESHKRLGLTTDAMLEPETNMGREAVSMLGKKIENKKKNIPAKSLDYLFHEVGTVAKPSNK